MDKYKIFNPQGWMAEFVARGATLTRLLLTRDVSEGQCDPLDVVLAVPEAQQGFETGPHFGVITGRYANRIAQGRFELSGKAYQLQQNEGTTCLHGGWDGLHQKCWAVLAHDQRRIHFSCLSAEGEAGFPGNLETHVTYAWEDSTLVLEFFATSDKATPINLCQHHYFNLNGVDRKPFEPILNHRLKLPSSHYLAIDDRLIPTGAFTDVTGSNMDFRSPRKIGDVIASDTSIFRDTGGVDHCFIMSPNDVITLESPLTGCRLSVSSDQPAFQVYTGNNLGNTPGKYGIRYPKYAGVCLEAQYYPDSPNHEHFPSCILEPDKRYVQRTLFEFGFFD